jgi:predicted nucleotidyltransferase
MMITQEQLENIVSRIIHAYSPEKIILFGSYASGTADEGSDLDLLLVKDTELSPEDRSSVIRKALRDIILPMDILVYTPAEVVKDQQRKFTFVHEIFKTGKVLYARS